MNGVSVALDETGRGGQREASRAKRGLRERIEQQRPITALRFTVLLLRLVTD